MTIKHLCFDCFSGISGDMTLGAFFDLGVPFDYVNTELLKLQLPEFYLSTEKVSKNGIGATSAVVDVKGNWHNNPTLSIIDTLVGKSSLPERVKNLSSKAFLRLAQAEAQVHRTTVEEIHFHEVGSVDAVVDIVGSMLCFNYLEENASSIIVSSSPLPLGSGFVKCAHGVLPVPAPATVELLRGVPVYSNNIKGELVTPTGAAIITTLCSSYSSIPEMTIEKIGYGAGKKDFDQPNLLRLFLGSSAQNIHVNDNLNTSDSDLESDTITILETNVDDTSPEQLAYTMDLLFQAKALDVYFTPIYMKKNRPATKIAVMFNQEDKGEIIETIFKHTSALGIRLYNSKRLKLKRVSKTISLKEGVVRLKMGYLGSELVNLAPEYEDCAKIALNHNLPIKTVFDKAIHHYYMLSSDE